MWRFMFVTFAVLFLAFYQLSGGANYAPSENSLQAQSGGVAKVEVAALADKPVAEPQASSKNVADDQNDTSRVTVTLASVKVEQPTLQTQSNKAERLTQPSAVDVDEAAITAAVEQSDQTEAKQVWPGAIELFEMQAEQAKTRAELRAEAEAAARASMDVRYVTGNVVNMRDGPGTFYEKIAALRAGTEVAVLDAPGNGWLELEVLDTGQVGWMADWLVSGN